MSPLCLQCRSPGRPGEPVQEGSVCPNRYHIDRHQLSTFTGEQVRTADIKNCQTVLRPKPRAFANRHEPPGRHECPNLRTGGIPACDERLGRHNSEPTLEKAYSLQRIEPGIQMVPQGKPCQILRRSCRHHAKPITHIARHHFARLRNQAEPDATGDFENMASRTFAKKIVFSTATKPLPQSRRVNPPTRLVGPTREPLHLPTRAQSESFRRPRLRSICRFFASQGIERSEEKSRAALSGETKGITSCRLPGASASFGVSGVSHGRCWLSMSISAQRPADVPPFQVRSFPAKPTSRPISDHTLSDRRSHPL
jgi:hypothetical protein